MASDRDEGVVFRRDLVLNGIKVFSASTHDQRARLGETMTAVAVVDVIV